MSEPMYLSVKQVHQRLNGAVSLRHLYNAVNAGQLPAINLLGKLVIDWRDVEKAIEAGRKHPDTQPPLPPKTRKKRRKPGEATALW